MVYLNKKDEQMVSDEDKVTNELREFYKKEGSIDLKKFKQSQKKKIITNSPNGTKANKGMKTDIAVVEEEEEDQQLVKVNKNNLEMKGQSKANQQKQKFNTTQQSPTFKQKLKVNEEQEEENQDQQQQWGLIGGEQVDLSINLDACKQRKEKIKGFKFNYVSRLKREQIQDGDWKSCVPPVGIYSPKYEFVLNKNAAHLQMDNKRYKQQAQKMYSISKEQENTNNNSINNNSSINISLNANNTTINKISKQNISTHNLNEFPSIHTSLIKKERFNSSKHFIEVQDGSGRDEGIDILRFPQKPTKHIPNFSFDQQLNRKGIIVKPISNDVELIGANQAFPNIISQNSKLAVNVNIKKMTSRRALYQDLSSAPYYNPKYDVIQEKPKNYQFSKISSTPRNQMLQEFRVLDQTGGMKKLRKIEDSIVQRKDSTKAVGGKVSSKLLNYSNNNLNDSINQGDGGVLSQRKNSQAADEELKYINRVLSKKNLQAN